MYIFFVGWLTCSRPPRASTPSTTGQGVAQALSLIGLAGLVAALLWTAGVFVLYPFRR